VNRDYSSRGSLGMINMRERADRIDGSLRVESQPGQGTKVMLVVPLSKHGQRV
jgi:signal transduction histidine kinase